MRIGIKAAALLASLVLSSSAFAQPAPNPSPEAMAVARDLIVTMKVDQQFKNLFPVLMRTFKPAIVQNRPEVEKDFNLLMPAMIEMVNARSGELIDAMAIVYANVLTVDELRTVIAFYKTPAGQKIISKTPELTQQSMLAGQVWGRSLGAGLREKMIGELRKRGHNI